MTEPTTTARQMSERLARALGVDTDNMSVQSVSLNLTAHGWPVSATTVGRLLRGRAIGCTACRRRAN
jgi:hypothetical protein